METGEEAAVCDLVVRVFNKFVAPCYSAEGIQRFLTSSSPERLRKRIQRGDLVLIALDKNTIIGVIEIRNSNHISRLFVDENYQGKDIARKLFHRALTTCLDRSPLISEITVNSSPNAVPAYEALGFQQTGPEHIGDGIRSIPMVYRPPNPKVPNARWS